MLRLSLLLFGILASCVPAQAQTFSGGFRAGLNFVTFSADKESLDGMTLERFNRTTGFHVGATFALAFTDLVGVKANFMYTQKGAEIIFEGPSYFYLYNSPTDEVGFSNPATARTEIDVVNSYLEIPVLAYYKIGQLEVEAGLSVGLLVNSRNSGSARYTDIVSNVNFGDEVVFNYDGNYLGDQAGFGAIQALSDDQPSNFNNVPTLVGAYYNHDRDDNAFTRLDFGAVFGVGYYLNSGLFLGVRYQHGFTDVSNPDNDLRQARAENAGDAREYNTGDKDYNRSYQASVGFRF